MTSTMTSFLGVDSYHFPDSVSRSLNIITPARTVFGEYTQEEKAECIDHEHKVVFGKIGGWDIAGRLRNIWKDSYFRLIKETLDEPKNRRWIFKKSKSIEWSFAFEAYMLGSTIEAAQPFIVTVCKARKIADRVSGVIRKMSAIQAYGFSFLTHTADIQLFAGGDEALTTFPMPSRIKRSLFGEAIRISTLPLTPVSRWSWATVGGLIQIDNVIYGMTVAHAFMRDHESDSENQEDHEDQDDSETDSLISDPPNDAEMSTSSQKSTLPITEPPTFHTRAPKVIYQVTPAEAISTGKLGTLPPNALFLGFLSLSTYEEDAKWKSIKVSDPQFLSTPDDWALIRIYDPRLWSENQLIDSRGKVIRCNSVADESTRGDILLASTKHGPLRCYSNGVKTGLFLSEMRSLQEVYQIDVSIGISILQPPGFDSQLLLISRN